jgi:hypothetical protein
MNCVLEIFVAPLSLEFAETFAETQVQVDSCVQEEEVIEVNCPPSNCSYFLYIN